MHVRVHVSGVGAVAPTCLIIMRGTKGRVCRIDGVWTRFSWSNTELTAGCSLLCWPRFSVCCAMSLFSAPFLPFCNHCYHAIALSYFSRSYTPPFFPITFIFHSYLMRVTGAVITLVGLGPSSGIPSYKPVPFLKKWLTVVYVYAVVPLQ